MSSFTHTRSSRDRLLPTLLFALLVAAEAVHAGVAIWQHRIPRGHDGFQYFTLQYYFLDNAIQSGEVAQWIPYMTHGTLAAPWYGIQGSLLQNVLIAIAPMLLHADLLNTFHLGMFVDEMALLTGSWLLARRFFRTPAAFFVTASVVGSSVWLDQPYWNFRLYYALPLVLELGHRFLETGRWRWAFLAANLLALQTVGNLPYFIPVASFVVVAYFVTYATANAREVWLELGALRWRAPALLAMAGGGASFLLAYAVLGEGTKELVRYHAGRLPDGTTDLHGFLTYGGGAGLLKWIDTAFGISPWFDLTVYAGILFAPLVLCGIAAVDRRRLHFVVLALALLLFTLGTWLSVMLYYTWPMMKYFRHIGLVSPLVKVFGCFVAGIGFEWLFDLQPLRSARAGRVAAIAGAVMLLSAACLAILFARRGQPASRYVTWLSDPGIDRPLFTYQPEAIVRRLRSAAMVAFTGALVIGVVPIWLRGARLTRSPRARQVVVCAVLVLVATDLYRFKFAYLFERSTVLGRGSHALTQPARLTYSWHRAPDLRHAVASNPRLQAAVDNGALLNQLQGRFGTGTRYWSNAAFFFSDEAGSSFRVDSWMKPLDQLMRMYWGDPINDMSIAPRGIVSNRFEFPLNHPAAAVITGVTADKLRFFTRAYGVTSEEALAPLLTDASYTGGRLFVLPLAPGETGGLTAAAVWSSDRALSSDDTCALAYDVQRFDANHLVVKVTSPAAAGTWMTYADVWHPLWRATVNGRPVPVHRAAMAYKAVPLQEGENLVHLQFGSAGFVWITWVIACNAALWIIGLASLMWRVIMPGR